jgi:DNA-binding MarR family transcriptional regulator
MTLSGLAERERVSAPSMNRTVNCLEESGYVQRTVDAVDRRKTNISLTERGRETVTQTLSLREAWLDDALKSLSEEDRAVMTRAAELMEVLATQ